MEAQAKILGPVHEKYITYASSEWSGEAAYFAQSRQSLRWLQIVKKLVMWFRYLSHKRAAKDQASMHICTVSLEPSLIAIKRKDVDEGSGHIVYIRYVI